MSTHLTLEQLDTAIIRYAADLEQAIEEGDEHRVTLLERITEALDKDRLETVDTIAGALHAQELQMELAQRRAEAFLVVRDRIAAAHEKMRLHILNYIDTNFPEDQRRLDGKLLWIRTQANSADALRTDELAVPAEYRSAPVTIMVPDPSQEFTDMLQAFLERFAKGSRIESVGKVAIDEQSIRLAIQTGMTVPGAKLERGRHLRFSKPKAEDGPRRTRGRKQLPAPAPPA